MAYKKFRELKGVILTNSNETVRSCHDRNVNDYEIQSRGDSIFEVDIENKRINKCVVKYNAKLDGIKHKLLYCDFSLNRYFKPTYSTRYGSNLPSGLKTAYVTYNKSSFGLLATNMVDAIKKLQKINNGKYFGALKPNDTIYCVNKSANELEELKVVELSYTDEYYNDGEHFNILTNKYRFKCKNSEYEENASAYTDDDFRVTRTRIDSKMFSIHMDKETAEKALREYNKSKENATKKKEESAKIPLGTPIRHKDSKGQELHYGDLVAYIKKSHYGHTRLSTGIIVGDSEKKVKVFDEEEHKNGKPNLWRPNEVEEASGIHIIENVNVLRFSLARAK